jgi:hypothetical protein
MKRFIETTIAIVLGALLLYVALSRFGLTQTLATIDRGAPTIFNLGQHWNYFVWSWSDSSDARRCDSGSPKCVEEVER